MSRSFFPILFALAALLASAAGIAAQDSERFGRTIASGTVEEKRTALFEIRNLRDPAASRTAIAALTDADPVVRAAAAFAVIYAPRDEAFRALLPNLNDGSDLVRRETAYALGKVGDPRAVDPIFSLFGADKSEEVKNACLVALGDIGDVSAVGRLVGILESKPSRKTEFRRRSAARAIGQIAQAIQNGTAAAVTPESFLPERFKDLPLRKHASLTESHPAFGLARPLLVRILLNGKEAADTRREAAFALGAIADPESADALRANLRSTDAYLAEICREALLKMGIRQ